MTLSPAQIRAARGLLDWTAKDLAVHIGIKPSSMSAIENGLSKGSVQTIQALEAALTGGGVEFGRNEGVSLRKGQVFELNGQEGLKTLMNMIYQHSMQNPQDFVRVSNVRQKQYAQALGKFIIENRTRMTAIKGLAPWRILLHPDDANDDLPPMGSIRVIKDAMFGTVGQYCFHRYLALVDFSSECHITVIDNLRLKETWDLIFDALWHNAPLMETQRA